MKITSESVESLGASAQAYAQMQRVSDAEGTTKSADSAEAIEIGGNLGYTPANL